MIPSGYQPRVFEVGVVYRAVTPSYETRTKTEKIYLCLGPSDGFRERGFPVSYAYICLLTGKEGEFHRDSYFAEAAEPL